MRIAAWKYRAIIHRDIPGQHEVWSPECWCQPYLVSPDDSRSIEEICMGLPDYTTFPELKKE